MRALVMKASVHEPETPKGYSSQAPKISFETANMVTTKLKERLMKSRRGVATKKHFEKQEIKPPNLSIPTLQSLDQIPDQRHFHQIGDGYSEKIYDNDPSQLKAREGIKLIKKKIVAQNHIGTISEDNTNLQTQAVSIIKKMNAQFNYLSLAVNTQIANENKDEKLNLKIAGADSVLHIANYLQNKEFNQITEISNVEDNQILKINARDGLTFFRLHHELDEIGRKKDNFQKMKEKYFDKKNPKDLLNYDKELDKFDDTQQHEKKNTTAALSGKAAGLNDKDKDLVKTAVEKITIKKEKMDKNFVGDFFKGINNIKERREMEKDKFS